jgi:SAM-dependent methyltransferase
MEKKQRPDQIKQWNSTYEGTIEFFGMETSDLGLAALRAFKEKEVESVLELGCGQGRDTWLFLENGFKVTALDYSEAGICQMRDKAEEMQCSVELKVQDARVGLPFPDDSFDAVYSHMFFTMELTEMEISFILDECLRVLKPGGMNIYSVRNDHDPHFQMGVHRGEDMWENPMGFIVHFFSEEKVRRLSTGYEIVSIKEFDDTSPPFVKKLYEVVLRKPQ